eukprot:3941073-Ditylum_brightwellii.AAC.1
MGAMVNENNFGAVNTNNPKAKGFYIVKFTSLPYLLTAQLDKKCPIRGVGELSVAKANPTSHILQQQQWLWIPIQ